MVERKRCTAGAGHKINYLCVLWLESENEIT